MDVKGTRTYKCARRTIDVSVFTHFRSKNNNQRMLPFRHLARLSPTSSSSMRGMNRLLVSSMTSVTYAPSQRGAFFAALTTATTTTGGGGADKTSSKSGKDGTTKNKKNIGGTPVTATAGGDTAAGGEKNAKKLLLESGANTTSTDKTASPIQGELTTKSPQSPPPPPPEITKQITYNAPIPHGELTAFLRTEDGTRVCKKLRRIGLIPGILVRSHEPPVPLQMFEGDLEAALRDREGSFNNTLYKLKIVTNEGKEEAIPAQYVVPRNMQIHPVSRKLVSCNFLVYEANKGTLIDMPILLLNLEKCPGVKRGGTLNQVLHSIRCLVRGNKIPNSLHLDMQGFQVGDKAKWSNIEVPPRDECEIIAKLHPNVLKNDPDITLVTFKGSRASRVGGEGEGKEAGGDGGEAALTKF